MRGPLHQHLHGLHPIQRQAGVIRDEDTDTVIGIIKNTANTHSRGDGRIFVLPILAAIRIDTDDRHADSLR